MKKSFLVIGTIVFLLIVLFSLRFILGGSEDDWICVNNEWIKHGVPRAPQPSGGCGEEKPNTNEPALLIDEEKEENSSIEEVETGIENGVMTKEATTSEDIEKTGIKTAEEMVMELGREIMELEPATSTLNNVQVKWNTEDGEEILIGKGVGYGEELGSRAVFEMYKNIVEKLKKIGWQTDALNPGSDTEQYKVAKLKKDNIVCYVIKTDIVDKGRSELELRCADI